MCRRTQKLKNSNFLKISQYYLPVKLTTILKTCRSGAKDGALCMPTPPALEEDVGRRRGNMRRMETGKITIEPDNQSIN